MKGCADVATKLHQKETAGDILIFLTGIENTNFSTLTLYAVGIKFTLIINKIVLRNAFEP